MCQTRWHRLQTTSRAMGGVEENRGSRDRRTSTFYKNGTSRRCTPGLWPILQKDLRRNLDTNRVIDLRHPVAVVWRVDQRADHVVRPSAGYGRIKPARSSAA